MFLTVRQAAKAPQMSSHWLKDQLMLKCSVMEGGLSITELCGSVFDILSSTDSNDHIQNSVCMHALYPSH